ncbi:MAG: diphthamide biosynthesis enzyme Dph2 [Desulfurococcaceae archaeon]
MAVNISCNGYEIPLGLIKEQLRYSGAKSIMLHAPDGLKHLYPCLADQLSLHGYSNIYYSLNPGYGACDIPLEEATTLGVDLILHLGHEEYSPNLRSTVASKVVYVPVYYVGEVSNQALLQLHEILRSLNGATVVVSSTPIELYARKKVVAYLEDKGFSVFEAETPVLGCLYSHVVSMEADIHVIVAGGLFHPIGLGLLVSKPVVALDPYMGRVWRVNKESEKVLRKRYYLLLKAREAVKGRVGLIAGTRPGQYRFELIKRLVEAANSHGFSVFHISSNYLTLERLYAIDAALGLDFYVVTSCPRLPIDDLADFHKPVLTPGEFLMILTDSVKYIYPW